MGDGKTFPSPTSGLPLSSGFVESADNAGAGTSYQTAGSPVSGAAGGDLSGTYPNPTVAKVGGVAVTGTPTAGQVPVASSGTAAAWTAVTASGAAGGDLSGTYPNPTVAQVNGVAITGVPTAGQVPVASSGVAAAWGTVAPSLTYAYAGYNTAGGSLVTMTQYRVYLKQITVAKTSLIASIGAYQKSPAGDHPTAIMAGLYADSGGNPSGLPLVVSTTQGIAVFQEQAASTPLASWVHLPIGFYVAAGTYWIAWMDGTATPAQLAYDGSGTDQYYASGGNWMGYAGGSTWYPLTATTNKYSLRAQVIS